MSATGSKWKNNNHQISGKSEHTYAILINNDVRHKY